jgi:leucyl aminopeptidase (aminopeptidase T)
MKFTSGFQQPFQMFWNSLDTDYMKMAAIGKNLKRLLKPGSELHITSASGTDIHMRVGQHPARINCGRCLENQDPFGPSMAYLPAGEVYTCVDPNTANGKVVVPSTDFRGQKITNVVLQFADGKIVDIQADSNVEMVRKMLESSSDYARMLSVVDLGINSRSHPLDGSDYYSWEMAGMITITTGGNSWAGGDIVSDAGLILHLAESDLTVDGEELIRNGDLLSDQLADY